MNKLLLIPIIAFGSLALSAEAYAQNCRNLDDNALWLQLFDEFNGQISAGDNKAALKTTIKLQDICKDSPVLNYAISRVYRNLGDHVNEVKYIQRATDNAEKFHVNEETLKLFWFARYEAENPEVTANRTELENSQQTMQELNAALEATRQRAEASEQAGEKMQIELQYKEENIYKALMWSGVGVAGIGIAMTVAGSILVVDSRKDAIEYDYEKLEGKVKKMYAISWGLLAAGIAATVAGTAATGYGGFHYVRTKKNKPEETVSFSISPTGAILSYSF